VSAPYREPTYVGDLPEVDRQYPVIVEETRRYVLWLDGEDSADAVEQFNCDPRDPDRSALFWFDWSASAPGRYDWDQIEHPSSDGGGWAGMLADAHVRTWRNHVAIVRRAAAKAACSAAGHPVARTGRLIWLDHCDTCGQIDPSERTAPDPSAVGGEPKATSPTASDLGGGS
jgi:hypothetical protein